MLKRRQWKAPHHSQPELCGFQSKSTSQEHVTFRVVARMCMTSRFGRHSHNYHSRMCALVWSELLRPPAMAAMAAPLHLRLWPHPASHLSRCRLSHAPRGGRAADAAIPTAAACGGVRHLARISCASQHVGGGSVERNDAAATGPLVKPEAKLTAKEAVETQMTALAHNDHPRVDHGLEVMYHFADAEGALNGGTLSQYFGFPSDLYHFGHFALKFKSRYPELICHNGYEIDNIQEDSEDHCEIRLKVIQVGNEMDSEWVFSLSKRSRGVLPPCWLTSSLLKVGRNV